MRTKQGGLSDIFLFMIIAFVILLVSGMFIYMGIRVTNELHTNLDDESHDNVNYTQTINEQMGRLNASYQSLYWISIFLIGAMIFSIFIGSYMVTTRPVFFIPYIFIVIIAIIVSVGISNAYDDITSNAILSSTFQGFVGSNYIMYYLPIWVTVIGFAGGIIMFVRMRSAEQQIYGIQ